MARISSMRNLGPVMERRLADVGIGGEADLRATGSVAAFVRLWFLDPRTSLNALHAMEAALLGIPWQDLPRARKAELLAEVLAALPEPLGEPRASRPLRRSRRS